MGHASIIVHTRGRWGRAAAVAKSSRRGWRLDQAPGGGNIDGVIALAMAVERAAEPAPEVRVLGWL